jgi:hypothetical protein
MKLCNFPIVVDFPVDIYSYASSHPSTLRIFSSFFVGGELEKSVQRFQTQRSNGGASYTGQETKIMWS